jgi:Alpha/beta hydrolase domain
MQAWVAEGTAPPESKYPRLSAGELTTIDRLKLPVEGVTPPKHPRRARKLDFGPDLAEKEIITKEPPEVLGEWPLLVPQVDADGLDRGGIRLPEMAAPLATITGWNLRAPERGASEEMVEFLGSIWPFSPEEIAKRYPSREDYMKRVGAAADDLVKGRYLLPQDRAWAVERAAKLWDAIVR